MNRCRECHWPLSTNYIEAENVEVFDADNDEVETVKFYKCGFCGEITPIEKVIDVGGV